MPITLQRVKSGLRRRFNAVFRTLLSPELPFPTKLRFIRHGFGRPSRRPGAYKLALRQGEILLSSAGNETDRNVVWDVFINRCYKTGYRHSTVVDIGAHKGYFGAYALTHGAGKVFSYEPERENFGLLDETARSFTRQGFDWETIRAAVASKSGEVELRVDPESWGHSLSTFKSAPSDAGGDIQVVDCAAMADVLESATRSSPRGRVIVKIDAEGAECEIVLKTPIETWGVVDEVFVEVHDFAACSSAEIADHLAGAGLDRVGEQFAVLHMSRPQGKRPSH